MKKINLLKYENLIAAGCDFWGGFSCGASIVAIGVPGAAGVALLAAVGTCGDMINSCRSYK